MPPQNVHQSIKLLPSPPAGRTGWPWELSMALQVHKNVEWPRISLITPNYNQGKFIEKMFRSVHVQGYPNLEHIIIDGGSTDESVEIIKKYEAFITFWVSEKDRGQTHAINKGLRRASGQIINWINADDYLCEGSLFEVGRSWLTAKPHFFMGAAIDRDADGKYLQLNKPKLAKNPFWMLAFWKTVVPQPSVFIDKSLIDQFGFLNEKLHFRMDWEFYLRSICQLGRSIRIAKSDVVISEIIYHSDCKSMNSSDGFRNDVLWIWNNLMPQLPLMFKLRVRWWTLWFESMIWMESLMAEKIGPYDLLKRVMRKPQSWPFRYTWGALRKSLFIARHSR